MNIITKKFKRLFESKNILKVKFYFHKLFGEKDPGKIGLDFTNKPSRKTIIQEIIDEKKYKSYLEIGCFKNDLFNSIICDKKIGVDPVSGGNIRKTSDEFFKTNEKKFDIIFIDGLHYYHQVKKDIKNSLNYLKEDGIILLHDCLPNNIYEQVIPRCQFIWNGDVWKAIVEFRTLKDVDTYTCYADHGIGVIMKRSNRNLLKIGDLNFSKLTFNQYFNNFKLYMNLIEYEKLKKII
jgi:hypothetical protein